MFNEIASPQRQGPLRRAWNYYLLQKGFGQAFATVYSLTTHARNTIGGSWIMASNGLNPFDRQTRDAFKILQNEIFTGVKNKDEALQELYVKFQRLGIVNQNVRKGEFSDLLNDAAKADWINMTANKFNSTSALGHVRKANDLITRTYVAEDDLFRIAAYTKELATLKRAYPNRAIDDLEREAADIVRNTFQLMILYLNMLNNFVSYLSVIFILFKQKGLEIITILWLKQQEKLDQIIQ